MSNNLVDIYVKQFTDNFELVQQEMRPRGELAVMVAHDGVGESMQLVDKIGTLTPQEVNDPGGDIVWQNPTTEARWVEPTFWDIAVPIKDQDKLKLLADPTSEYVTASVEGHNRQITRICRDAALGSAAVGKSGTSTQAFDTTNNRIAVNYGSAGNTGLSCAKLLKSEQRLLAAHVDPVTEHVYCWITSKQLLNLKREPQFISADYNPSQVLVQGGVVAKWGIFHFLHTEELGTDGSGYRRVIVNAKKGIHLKYWQEKTIRVTERVDKKGYPFQVYSKCGYGAVRLWEERVVEILCNESGL